MTDGGWSGITRYDIKEGRQRLQLYLDPASEQQSVYLTVPLTERFTVNNRMPAQVTLVDYYNPALRQTVFYSVQEHSNQGEEEEGEDQAAASCAALSLTCEALENAQAVLIGNPGKLSGDTLVVKNALPYKSCRGSFVKQMKAKVGFARSADKVCVEGLGSDRSFFLLQYTDDNSGVEITGMASYDSVLSKVTECYTVLSECSPADTQ